MKFAYGVIVGDTSLLHIFAIRDLFDTENKKQRNFKVREFFFLSLS